MRKLFRGIIGIARIDPSAHFSYLRTDFVEREKCMQNAKRPVVPADSPAERIKIYRDEIRNSYPRIKQQPPSAVLLGKVIGGTRVGGKINIICACAEERTTVRRARLYSAWPFSWPGRDLLAAPTLALGRRAASERHAAELDGGYC